MEKNKKTRTGVQKAIRIISIILIILIIALAGVAAGAWGYINNMLGKINKETIDTNAIGITEETKQSLKGYRNIALLGIDSRADDYGLGNRTDCIIIASINEETKDVKMFSVYRDTYLEVVEKNTKRLDKVTHAYSYGGAQNTLLALNTNLDLNIKEYVTINFDSLISSINAMDGVDIDIEKDELKYINDYIDALIQTSGVKSKHVTTTGVQRLDGVQAVAYSRIRYTAGGDYKRTERMREVVQAMVKRAKGLNITQLQKLATKVLPLVRTNLSESDIMGLLPVLMKVNFTTSMGWPYETKGKTMDRWYGIPITLESNVEKLHKEFFGNTNYVVNDKLVRGLDYYSDTVFEIKSSKLGSQATVLAGGRYDRLLEILGNAKVPGIGFAAGMERIAMLMDDSIISENEEKIYVIYFDDTKEYFVKTVNELRKNGIKVNFDYNAKSFGAQMKKANRENAEYVLILGEEERDENVITVKKFSTGEQKKYNFEEVLEILK